MFCGWEGKRHRWLIARKNPLFKRHLLGHVILLFGYILLVLHTVFMYVGTKLMKRVGFLLQREAVLYRVDVS